MEKTQILRKKQPRLRLTKRNASISESPHTPIKAKKQKVGNDIHFNENNSSDSSVYKTPSRNVSNCYENNDNVNNDSNCSFSPSNHMFLSQEPTTQDVGWGKEAQTPPSFSSIRNDEFRLRFKKTREHRRKDIPPINELPKVGTPKGFKKFLKDYQKHQECQLKSKNLNSSSVELDSSCKENILNSETNDIKSNEIIYTSNTILTNIEFETLTKSNNFKKIDEKINKLSKINNIVEKPSTNIVKKTNLYTNIKTAENNEIVDLLDDSDSEVLLAASQQVELIVSKNNNTPQKVEDEFDKICHYRKSLSLLFQDSFDEALLSLENDDTDNEIMKSITNTDKVDKTHPNGNFVNSPVRNTFSRYNSMPIDSPQKPNHQLKRHPSTSSISTSSAVSTCSSDKSGIFERKMIAMQRLAKTKQRQQFNGGSARNPNILFTNKK